MDVCVVGSGIVGRSWGVVFAKAGHTVHFYDCDEQQACVAKEEVANKLHMLAKAGLINLEQAQLATTRIQVHTSLQGALEHAKYVQECVPENLSLKTDVFQQLDLLAPENAILASSSSTMGCSSFTKDMKRRNRCIVCHPVNPPFLLPLVELIPSPWTDADVVAFCKEFLESCGQEPILLKKEIPGFAVNRLQYAVLGEAFRLVQDGVLSAEDVDKTFKYGLARRWSFMGPFETIHLNAPGGVRDYCDRYQQVIQEVLKTEDNGIVWQESTISAIEEELKSNPALQNISTRVQWRDRQLLALALLQRQQEQ